ncbi:MAG: GNAT family N-acetyltransferase [Breznakibacter sp.]
MNIKILVYRFLNYVLRCVVRLLGLKLKSQILVEREPHRIGNTYRDGLLLTVKIKGVKVGTAYLTYGSYYFDKDANYAVLYSLFVHPVYRRLGIGTDLVTAAYGQSTEKGFEELFVMCADMNYKMHALLQRIGYADSRQSKFYGLYQRELNAYENRRLIGFFRKTE